MRHILTVFVAVICTMLLTGCPAEAPPPTPDQPETEQPATEVDYLAIVQSAVAGGSATMRTTQAQAITNGKFTTCVVAGSAVTALDTASAAIANVKDGTPAIPEVFISLGVCETLERTLPETKVPDVVSLYILAGIDSVRSLLGVAETTLKTENCLAWRWLDAGLGYLRGATVPVVDFIRDPSTAQMIPAGYAETAECTGPPEKPWL